MNRKYTWKQAFLDIYPEWGIVFSLAFLIDGGHLHFIAGVVCWAVLLISIKGMVAKGIRRHEELK